MEGSSRETEEERSRRIDEESLSLKYNPRSFFSLNNPKRVLKYCFKIDRDFFPLTRPLQASLYASSSLHAFQRNVLPTGH